MKHMNNLTKEDILKFPQTAYARCLGKQLATQVVNEMLNYKSIEEELGCSLKIVFKAYFNNKIYAKNPYNFDKEIEIVEVVSTEITKTAINKEYCIAGMFTLPSESFNHCYWLLKDYKKTWWLKEDRSE